MRVAMYFLACLALALVAAWLHRSAAMASAVSELVAKADYTRVAAFSSYLDGADGSAALCSPVDLPDFASSATSSLIALPTLVKRFAARNSSSSALAKALNSRTPSIELVLGSNGNIGHALVSALLELDRPVLAVESREHLDLRDPSAMDAFAPLASKISVVYLLAFDASSGWKAEGDYLALVREVVAFASKRAWIKLVYPTLGDLQRQSTLSALERVKLMGEELIRNSLPKESWRAVYLTELSRYTVLSSKNVLGLTEKCINERSAVIPLYFEPSGAYLSAREVAEALTESSSFFAKDSNTVLMQFPTRKSESLISSFAKLTCVATPETLPDVWATKGSMARSKKGEIQTVKITQKRQIVAPSELVVNAVRALEKQLGAKAAHVAVTIVLARGASPTIESDLLTIWNTFLKTHLQYKGRLELLVINSARETPNVLCAGVEGVVCVSSRKTEKTKEALAIEASRIGLTHGRGEYLLLLSPDDSLTGVFLPTVATLSWLAHSSTLRSDTIYLGTTTSRTAGCNPEATASKRRRVFTACSTPASCEALPQSTFPGPVLTNRETTTLTKRSAVPPLSLSQTCDLAIGVVLAHRRRFETMPVASAPEEASTYDWRAVLTSLSLGRECGSLQVAAAQKMSFARHESSWISLATPSISRSAIVKLCATHASGSFQEDERGFSTLSRYQSHWQTAASPGPAGTPAGRHVLPVVVVWPALMQAMRVAVGTYTARTPRVMVVVVPINLSFEQMAEIAAMENVALLTKEWMERKDDKFDGLSTQLHGFQQALEAFPEQALVLLDLRTSAVGGHPLRYEADLVRMGLEDRVVAYGPTPGGMSEHLPFLYVPGQATSSEAQQQRQALKDFCQRTLTCVTRSLDPRVENASPTARECQDKAAAFVKEFVPLAPFEEGARKIALYADNAGFCFVEHARRLPASNPIPEAKRRDSICIVTPTLGKKNVAWQDHPMFKWLLTSLFERVSPGSPFHFRHYVAFELGDARLDQADGQVEFREAWKRVTSKVDAELYLVRIPYISGDTSYLSNQAFQAAFDDGCEYLWYICDDIRVHTANWDVDFVNALRKSYPPNTGLVGTAKHFNTQPFFHRSHMEAFGLVYPRVTHNWYGDTIVYDLYKSTNRMRGPEFRFENVNAGGERYVICNLDHWPYVKQWEAELAAYEKRLTASSSGSSFADVFGALG